MKEQFQLKKILFICIIFATLNSYSQNIIASRYFFVNNEKLFSFEQRNDTIFEYRYYKNFEFSKKPRRQYKIVKIKKKANTTLLLIERVDSIKLSSKPLPDDRFSIIGIEKLSDNKIKVVNEVKAYTRDSISKITFNFDLIENKFGYTYYEENYLKSLNSDFEIDEKLADEVMKSMKNSYSELLKQYNNTKTGDIYRTGIIAEILGREMVKRNLSPIAIRTKFENSFK